MLYTPTTHFDFDLLADMLTEYISELHTLDPNVRLRNKDQLIQEYFYAEDTHFILFADNYPIGFAIVGYNTNCHPNADMYIEEFYIRPEFRQNGNAYKYANKILDNINSVCFFELKNNKIAKAFWQKVFWNWKELSIKDSSNAPKWLDFYAYSRS